ncbi:MAG: AAA family ATPase [Verrucomicrobiota bacterium]|jgi:predicted ATPase
MITTFRIESFKSIESAELALGTVNVFIGANGSGKSNLLEAFAVLAAAAFGRVDLESLVRRGCRPGGYYQPLFPGGQLDAEIKILAAGNGVSYCVSLANPMRQRPAGWEFRREVLKNGEHKLVDRETRTDTGKGDPQAGLAALRLAEMSVESEAAVFLRTLAAYSIYAPDTPVLRGWTQDPQLREPVGLSGGRLADAVAELQKQEGGSKLGNQFSAGVEWFGGFGIVESAPPAQHTPKRAIAFIDRFFRTDNEALYLLNSSDVNEGSLYLLFVDVLCLHKAAPKLFALDNADHGLNPIIAKNLMRTMCQWLLGAKEERQVLLTTQNPMALDGLPLQDDRVRLFTVDRNNRGGSTIRRLVITEELQKKASEGWPLSRLWVNGLIGGVPNV